MQVAMESPSSSHEFFNRAPDNHVSDGIAYADLIDAEPAPREVTETGRRYAAAQGSYAWSVLVVLLVVAPAMLWGAMSGWSDVASTLAIGGAAAIGLGVWASHKRGRVRKVLVDGEQRPAQIRGVSHLVIRQGLLQQARRVSMTVEVDGRRATCVSWQGDLDEAEAGAWIRVLVHPDVPFVVPVVSVT